MPKKPFHVAIVPDGNRRWARARNLPVWMGHEAGYKNLKKILEKIWGLGVTHFTFWALSIDNLKKRDHAELGFLKSLLKTGIRELKESPGFKNKKVCFRVVGRWKDFMPELEADIKELEDATQIYVDRTFTLAVAYDGVEEDYEMIAALRKEAYDMASYGLVLTLLRPEDVDRNLRTGFLPDVDLYIRTAGEPHISSGFLMHKMKNPRLASSRVFWPDFSARHLKKAIDNFHSKERRFGG